MPLSSSPAEPPDASPGPHFLRAVTDMAERRSVVANAAIYTDTGIKLVDKGGRISTRLYDQLVQHRLRDPIENHLGVENAVDTEQLVESARALLKDDALCLLLVQALGSAGPLLEPLRSLPLPPPVSFKLTVMRDQREALFRHSMQMVLVSLFLAIREGLDLRTRTSLAAAALLHDVGVLHMDPAWQDKEKKIQGAERKHLVAHPVTAMLLVRDAKVYARSVELAVLEHHERMDGTGYPRGLQGSDLSPLGRILLLAEVVCGFYAKLTEFPAQQLSLMLRLNHRKFPPALVAHVMTLLRPVQAQGMDSEFLQTGALRCLEVLSEALQRWDSIEKQATGAAQQKAQAPGLAAVQAMARDEGAAAFVDQRVRSLEKVLAEAGMHPAQQSPALLEQLQGDAPGMAEVAWVGQEALWQLRSIANACLRRWQGAAQAAPAGPPGAASAAREADALQWCDWVLRQA